jgi:ADP-heptose:LPS heptosyltransferase
MISPRTRLRAALVAWAACYSARRLLRLRRGSDAPRRILVAHHLLLGDTLMLTPLLKKLRLRYPEAELVMTVPPAFAILYAGRPYGVQALPFDPRDPAGFAALRPLRGFDLALLPAETRYSWLARALDAERIVAFEESRARPGNWLVGAWRPMPAEAASFGDIAATLVEGPAPPPYSPREWPAPPAAPFDEPRERYGLLHLGASSAHKHWPAENWRAVAETLSARGLAVVLSAGPGEAALIRAVDPEARYLAFPGNLDLGQLWRLLQRATLVVCPDTGVAHLARLAGAPTVALFGPGSPGVSGAGHFWSESSFVAVWHADIPCRDQHTLFGRVLPWVSHCWRGPNECPRALCTEAITASEVNDAVRTLDAR